MPAQTVSRTAPHRPPVGQRRGRNSESPWPPHHQTSGEPGFPTAWTPPYAGKGATGPTRAGAASIDQPPNACPGSVQRHGPTSDRLGLGIRRPARRERPQKGHSLPWRQALGRWRRQRRAHVRRSQPASPSRDFTARRGRTGAGAAGVGRHHSTRRGDRVSAWPARRAPAGGRARPPLTIRRVARGTGRWGQLASGRMQQRSPFGHPSPRFPQRGRQAPHNRIQKPRRRSRR